MEVNHRLGLCAFSDHDDVDLNEELKCQSPGQSPAVERRGKIESEPSGTRCWNETAVLYSCSTLYFIISLKKIHCSVPKESEICISHII